MHANIKSVFDESLSHVKYNTALAKEIRLYGQGFVNKNEDHVKGFGTTLLGVYPIRFTSTDKYDWLEGILNIDDEYQIRKKVIDLPTIDESWVRGTDVMNLSCLYITHKYMNSDLGPKQKEEAMIDALLVLHYKLFGSLMAYFFRYPADEGTAQATYAALSKKYAVKQHGSWHGVLLNRCRDIISLSSIHYETLKHFDDDDAVQYMVTDIQGRLRALVKNIWAVFDETRQQDAKILTVGGTIELDGEMVVRDVARTLTPYRRYLAEIVLDRDRFIKQELISVIASAMQTMSEVMLSQALHWLIENNVSKNRLAMEFTDETLQHAFDYIANDRESREKLNDLGGLLARLRALYMASRSSDPALLKLRKDGEKLIKKATTTRNESMIAAVRSGVMLYIVLRTFSMNYYK